VHNLKKIAIIPARGGSKGIKRKNLSKIGELTLLEWAITFAKDYNEFDIIYIDTDDLEIKQIGESYNCAVPRLRPSNLATDESSIIDSLLDFLEFIESDGLVDDTSVVLLQTTTPFRKTLELVKALQILEKSEEKVVISASPPLQSPKDFLVMNRSNSWIPALTNDFRVTNRQDLQEFRFITGGIYAFKKRFLVENRTLLVEDKFHLIECDQISGIDIDSEIDLEIARAIFSAGLNQ